MRQRTPWGDLGLWYWVHPEKHRYYQALRVKTRLETGRSSPPGASWDRGGEGSAISACPPTRRGCCSLRPSTSGAGSGGIGAYAAHYGDCLMRPTRALRALLRGGAAASLRPSTSGAGSGGIGAYAAHYGDCLMRPTRAKLTTLGRGPSDGHQEPTLRLLSLRRLQANILM
jgi:hypothetical protein